MSDDVIGNAADLALFKQGTYQLLICYADFCTASKTLFTYLAELNTTAQLAYMNVEEQPDLTFELAIKATPAFILFRRGNELSRRYGTFQIKILEDWLKEFAPKV